MLAIVLKVIGIFYFMANGYIAGSLDAYHKDVPDHHKYLNLIINLLLGVPRFLLTLVLLSLEDDLKNYNDYD